VASDITKYNVHQRVREFLRLLDSRPELARYTESAILCVDHYVAGKYSEDEIARDLEIWQSATQHLDNTNNLAFLRDIRVVDIRDVRPVDDTCIYVLLSKLRDLKTLYMETCGDYAEAYKDSWLNIDSTPFPSVETLVWRAAPVVSDDLWGNLRRFSVSPSHLVMISMPKLKHVIGNNCTGIYESHIRGSVPATCECNLASMEFTDCH